jgi:polyisoprenoid-binding protein YceI
VPGPRALAALVGALLGGTVLASPTFADTQRFIIDPDKSRVSFDAFHPFAFGTFSAAADGPTGEVELDLSDLRQPIKGSLTVAVAGLRSGEAGRDKDIRRALDADHHAEIRYRVDKVESSFPSLAENNDVILTIHGVLTVKDIDRPTTFAGRVRLRPGGGLWVRGESWVKPRDWGVPLIRTWMISMKDSVLAIFDLTLSRAK